MIPSTSANAFSLVPVAAEPNEFHQTNDGLSLVPIQDAVVGFSDPGAYGHTLDLNTLTLDLEFNLSRPFVENSNSLSFPFQVAMMLPLALAKVQGKFSASLNPPLQLLRVRPQVFHIF